MFPVIFLEFFLLAGSGTLVDSFSISSTKTTMPPSLSTCMDKSRQSRPSTLLLLAGGGMGMGTTTTTKGKKKKKKNKQIKKKVPSFDVAASLLKSESKYDELCTQSAKAYAKEDDDLVADDRTTTEFVIAARCSPQRIAAGSNNKNLKSVSDWIPVAQLCLARPVEHRYEEAYEEGSGSTEGFDQKLGVAAVSYFCRELAQAASLGSTKFRDVPRQDLQYSIEPVDSYFKHVDQNFVGKKEKEEGSMGKAEARQVLDLVTTTDGDRHKQQQNQASSLDDIGAIKASYRKKVFALHPDRFVGIERTPEQEEADDEEFARVKLAYETLSSGIATSRKSWYESLGGRERTDFVGPIELLPMDDAKNIMFPENHDVSSSIIEKSKNDCAICRLDPEIVRTFLIRNQNAY